MSQLKSQGRPLSKMKRGFLLYLLLMLVVCTCNKRPQPPPILNPGLSLESSELRTIIKDYWNQNRGVGDDIVVTMWAEQRFDTAIFYISSIATSFGLKEKPPTFYCAVGHCPFKCVSVASK